MRSPEICFRPELRGASPFETPRLSESAGLFLHSRHQVMQSPAQRGADNPTVTAEG